MRLIIDVITRDENDYLAVACPEGALLSDAGVGGSDSERNAVQQAVNAYYTNADTRDRAAHPLVREPLPDELVVDPLHPADAWIAGRGGHVSGARVAATVAVDPAGIKALLESATASGRTVLIDGEKVDGQTYLNRRIVPDRIDGDYVICFDQDAQDSRTFKLSGIQRAEVVA